jgi:hypothetical protein
MDENESAPLEIAPAEQIQPSRPFALTLLAILLILLSGMGLFRSGWYLLNWSYSISLMTPWRYWWLINSSLVYGLLGLPAAFLLWKGERAAKKFTFFILGLFTLLFWIEKMFITANAAARIDWPFALVVNLLIIASIISILLSPQADRFLRKEEK